MASKTILTLINYYLPGFKAGGPIHSISNLVKNLGKEHTFKIITSDRDLGDEVPFNSIESDKWNRRDGTDIFYLKPEISSYFSIHHLLKEQKHDIIYLNSFFSFKFSIFALILNSFFIKKSSIIISPKGEFSPGALKLKKFKKKMYIIFAKLIGLYKNVSWQASTHFEKQDILAVFPNAKVLVAPDIFPTPNNESIMNGNKETGLLKAIYLSRISPKKNLLGSLNVLSKIKGRVNYDIYGPIEDKKYWQKCQNIIAKMPTNIKVEYKGQVAYSEVLKTFSHYDLFFLMTHGENYGYVIIEALIAGCPALISDTTPWQDLAAFKAGVVQNLSEENNFLKSLEYWIEMDNDEHLVYRQGAKAYANTKLINEKIIDQYRHLFS